MSVRYLGMTQNGEQYRAENGESDVEHWPECGGEITPDNNHAACLDEAQSRAEE